VIIQELINGAIDQWSFVLMFGTLTLTSINTVVSCLLQTVFTVVSHWNCCWYWSF